MDNSLHLEGELKQRFDSLPEVVQRAILSSEIPKNLRKVGETQRLHVDQWELLERKVILAVLGFLPMENLESEIVRSTGLAKEITTPLVERINEVVFEPIREELERQLEHPDAHEATQTDLDAARTQLIGGEQKPQTPPPTPPAPKPDTTVAHMPTSGEYKPGETSTQRASIVDDPYREPPK